MRWFGTRTSHIRPLIHFWAFVCSLGGSGSVTCFTNICLSVCWCRLGFNRSFHDCHMLLNALFWNPSLDLEIRFGLQRISKFIKDQNGFRNPLCPLVDFEICFDLQRILKFVEACDLSMYLFKAMLLSIFHPNTFHLYGTTSTGTPAPNSFPFIVLHTFGHWKYPILFIFVYIFTRWIIIFTIV